MFQVNNIGNTRQVRLADIQDAHKTLIDGCSQMKGKWFISDGTLLGFHRNKDFIPQDTDIDVAVMVDDVAPDIDLDMELIRTATWDDKIVQKAYRDLNECIFDIFFYYKEGDYYVTRGDYGFIKLPAYEIIDYKTKYGTFPAPKQTEEYLTLRYGDWKTPKQDKGIHVHNS